MGLDTTLIKVKQAYNVKTNSELAEKLDTTRGAVEGWARRKEVPHKYLIQCTFDTGVSLDWLLSEDKPTFHISGGTGNISQQNLKAGAKVIYNTSEKENELNSFENVDPVFISFKKAYECVKNEKNKLNELEDLLEDFYRKYR
ncbi:helix-turn-helix domain containing protein [Aliarcobacter cryaerophilus]|uniref:helix-turn-helix domain-containing protein n=1 Tax=Aliarcobacter cryaerophilus TaxID=28198 RepID=UPI003DA3DB5C